MREEVKEKERGGRSVVSGLAQNPGRVPRLREPRCPAGRPWLPWPRSSFPANAMGSRSSRVASGRRAFNDKVNNCIRGASVGGAE